MDKLIDSKLDSWAGFDYGEVVRETGETVQYVRMVRIAPITTASSKDNSFRITYLQ